ncbi:hypothetical protein Droror1_Dr00014807 [Drosera rotundifolia]
MLAAVLAQSPELHGLARRAFVTYLKAIFKRKDKEVFDVTKLDTNEFAASLGFPMPPELNSASLGFPLPPELRFLIRKNKETVKITDDDDEKDNSDDDESDEELLAREGLSSLKMEGNKTKPFL